MKYFLPIFLALVLIGAGCTKSSNEPQIEVSSGDVKIEYRGEQEVTYDEGGVAVTNVVLGDQPDVQFEMTIDNNSFSPNSLTVQPEQKIAITFTQVTGNHTFKIDETNTSVELNEQRTVYFIAPTEPGTYKFYSGTNPAIEGTLVVE